MGVLVLDSTLVIAHSAFFADFDAAFRSGSATAGARTSVDATASVESTNSIIERLYISVLEIEDEDEDDERTVGVNSYQSE
jgi:hypothetical protein